MLSHLKSVAAYVALALLVLVSAVGMHQAAAARNASQLFLEAAHRHNRFWSDGWFGILQQIERDGDAVHVDEVVRSFEGALTLTTCFSALRSDASKDELVDEISGNCGFNRGQASDIVWIVTTYHRLLPEIAEAADYTDRGSKYSGAMIEILRHDNWQNGHPEFARLHKAMREDEKKFSALTMRMSRKSNALFVGFFGGFCFFLALTFLLVNRRTHLAAQRRLRQSRDVLRDKEKSLQQAQSVAKIGSWQWDISTDRFAMSDELFRVHGWTRTGGSPSLWEVIRARIHPDDAADFFAAAKSQWRFGGGEPLTYRLVFGENDIRWINAFVPEVVSRDTTGGPLSVIGTLQDITPVKEAEAERARLEQRYLQSRKLESIGRLAGGVAHDFNNLLLPIIGYSEMMLKKAASIDSHRVAFERILDAGTRARVLVAQLLAFSRKQTLEYKVVDINAAIAGLEKLLRSTIPENITLSLRPAPDIKAATADVGQIEQVLMNLVVNAVDAMPDGGLLSIETSMMTFREGDNFENKELQPGVYVVMNVSDTGHGMEEEIRKSIFEPFFSTKGQQGTGLGLATVFGIVKQHSGHIDVYSEVGRGTSFRIYLPTADDEPSEETAPPERDTPASGDETVLLVEDNPLVRELSREILEEFGYRVLEAKDGASALDILRQNNGPVDLLLTDVVLPRMNGKELYHRIAEILPDIKVLYMSGYSDNVIAHQGILDSGVNFIQKPFNMETLSRKIREVLDRRD